MPTTGGNPWYLKLHTETHQQLKYFIKHAFGESTGYNTFNIHPWYGASQGAGDVAIQWIVLSDSPIMAYWSKVHQWALYNHWNNHILDQGIDTFIDDTTIINASTPQHPISTTELIKQMQENITLWNGLLKASGRALNPTKCIWDHFQWSNMNGTLTMTEPKQDTSIQIHLSWYNTEAQQVPKLNLTTANQYLGVQMTMNGNWK